MGREAEKEKQKKDEKEKETVFERGKRRGKKDEE